MSRLLPAGLHRLARFGMAGIAATLFYFAIVNALVLAAGVEPVTASVAGYFISLVLSYSLQSRFAFRASGDSFPQIARYLLTALAGLGISWGVMVLVSSVLQWPYLVGALAVCVLIPAANYIVFSTWVFRHAPGPEAGSSTDRGPGHER